MVLLPKHFNRCISTITVSEGKAFLPYFTSRELKTNFLSKILKDASGGLRNCNLEPWLQGRQEANDPVVMRVILAIQYISL